MKTYTYDSFKVTLDGSKVVESNHPAFPVGMVVAKGQMAACGWKAAKKAVNVDVWGRKIS